METEEKHKYLDEYYRNPSRSWLFTLEEDRDLEISENLWVCILYQFNVNFYQEPGFSPYTLDPSWDDMTIQYYEMKQKNMMGNRLEVMHSRIQGWGVFAKQLIR